TLADGATLYTTLEPCSHHGKTPPCAEAVIAAGIKRVVAAMEDSDLRVKGTGFAKLRNAGIAVEIGPGAREAAEINAGFFLRVATGRPPVFQRLSPDGIAILPSSVVACFSVTRGRPVATRRKNPALISAASRAPGPISTAMPAFRSLAKPVPFTRRSESSIAATTRLMPAAITASAQGGVLP